VVPTRYTSTRCSTFTVNATVPWASWVEVSRIRISPVEEKSQRQMMVAVPASMPDMTLNDDPGNDATV
jgi:hypothetical protein